MFDEIPPQAVITNVNELVVAIEAKVITAICSEEFAAMVADAMAYRGLCVGPETDGQYSKKPSKRETARRLLKKEIGAGQSDAIVVMEAAQEAGISERTLQRAKADLGVVSSRSDEPFVGRWIWQLPEPDERPTKTRGTK